MAKLTQEEIDAQVTDLGVKKTMVSLAALLIAGGATKLANWDAIVTEMQPKDGATGESKPREVTMLKDIEGVVLGRKCSVTEKWFPMDRFFSNGTVIKEADAAKNKLYSASKVMEKDAQVHLATAREATNTEDKVAAFEAYDAELEKAKAHRATPIEVDPKWLEGSFDDINALAANMGVEVNPVKPEPEETAESAD